MTYKIITPAAMLPLTVAQVKNYLKIDPATTADDNLILASIIGAMERCQKHTSHILIRSTVREYFDNFPSDITLKLGLAPLFSLSSLNYIDDDGNLTVLPSANYTVDEVSTPPRIMLKKGFDWPSNLGQYPNRVVAEYTVGYANDLVIPGAFRAAMLFFISAFYRTDQVNELFEEAYKLLNDFRFKK
jgi:uncharacterized phiE125 gp8 family phage protein